MSRAGVRVIVAGGLILLFLLVAVANPLGDALVARGVSSAGVGLILLFLFTVICGVPIYVLMRRGRSMRDELHAQQSVLFRDWAQQAGAKARGSDQELPAVLDRIGLKTSKVVMSGGISRPAELSATWWDQEFSNPGALVTANVPSLAVVMEGAPTHVSLGIGRTTGLFLSVWRKSARRWSSLPPKMLPIRTAHHPWGVRRAAVWADTSSPPVRQLRAIATALDELGGWLLVHEGKIEVSAQIQQRPVHPQELALVGRQVAQLIGTDRRC